MPITFDRPWSGITTRVVASGTIAVGAKARVSVSLGVGSAMPSHYLWSVRDTTGGTWAVGSAMGSQAAAVSAYRHSWIEMAFDSSGNDVLMLANQTNAATTVNYSVLQLS